MKYGSCFEMGNKIYYKVFIKEIFYEIMEVVDE